jgi:hypothetical protein
MMPLESGTAMGAGPAISGIMGRQPSGRVSLAGSGRPAGGPGDVAQNTPGC